MLYDRNVDNNEIGRKIWKICIAFNNDLRSRERFMIVEWFLNVEWFVLHWMIFTTLNDMYYVEWFVLRWMICITLNDLYYVEWFVQRCIIWQSWIICSAALNDLYYENDFYYDEWFVLCWMISTMLNDFLLCCKICTTSIDLCSQGIIQMICTTLNHLDYWVLLSIGFLMSARSAYLRKYCKTFCTNLWVDFSLIWKYQEEIYSALPQKLVI